MGDPLEILWPTRCGGCDTDGRGRLCPACRSAFAPTPVMRDFEAVGRAMSSAPYAAGIGQAIRRAKGNGDRSLLAMLAAAFAETLAPMVGGGAYDAIVAAPSPWTRRIRRGFSAGHLLADALARRTHVVRTDALALSPGVRNATLGAAGRRRNLVGRLRGTRAIAGRILLVDDVVTTGATADACARILSARGAHTVDLAALCVVDRDIA